MTRRVRMLASRGLPWTGLDPEPRNALLLYGGIGLVLVFVLALIAYGYYTERIAPKHETVLTVGTREFDFAFLERRARAEAGGAPVSTSNAGQVIASALALIEREEVTRQTATRRGLRVTEAEIEAGMRDMLRVDEEDSRERFASRLRTRLLRDGLSLAEFREIATANVLADKLLDEFAAMVPAEAEHADLRLIQVRTQTEALEIKEDLERGDPFASLAATRSIHPSRSSAGEVGWVPRDALPEELEEVAFSQGAGTISDFIETEEGFFFLLTQAVETREVDDDGRTLVSERGLSLLLEETRQEIGSAASLTVGQVNRIAVDLIRSSSG